MKTVLVSYKYINKMFRERFGTFSIMVENDADILMDVKNHLDQLMMLNDEVDKGCYAVTDMWWED